MSFTPVPTAAPMKVIFNLPGNRFAVSDVKGWWTMPLPGSDTGVCLPMVQHDDVLVVAQEVVGLHIGGLEVLSMRLTDE